MQITNSNLESSNLKFLRSGLAMGLSGLSGVSTVRFADYLRFKATRDTAIGFMCGKESMGRSVCLLGTTGKIGVPFCAERVSWLQPAKPILAHLGTRIHDISEFPSRFFQLSENSVVNITLGAAGEELFIHGFVQQYLLRKLQAKILQKISPQHEKLVDHPLAKASRIAASSLLFGLMHTDNWECRYGGTIPEIAAGIVFGTLAETRVGLVGSTIAHTVANLLISRREVSML
jgi:membrane protease YdiL (CAAX protease family)